MSGGARAQLRQLLQFLLGSCLGLAVDLSVFALGIRLGAAPWLANTLSAGCAVVVVYLFVTKYAFRGGRSRSSFLMFVAWYVTSILGFSLLIELLHVVTGWAPFLCKLVSLPFSFAANFGVSKVLFRQRPAAVVPGAGPAPGGSAVEDTEGGVRPRRAV
ncbi:GtrA family protein [Modestobacter sp. SYSU DS0511]